MKKISQQLILHSQPLDFCIFMVRLLLRRPTSMTGHNGNVVFHLMGEGKETRRIVMQNGKAVIHPS